MNSDHQEIIEYANLGIRIALAAIEVYLKAAEAAQSGDLETAQKHLAEARHRWSQTKAEWEAAGN